jgi:hypothetical protein
VSSQRARVEQSKGLKDRLVFLSQATIAALQDYLSVRGRAESQPDHVFIYRHKPLGRFYCGQRLHTYGERLEQAPALGQLLALVDALHTGTLNADQAELVRLLRSGLDALSEKEFQDVKVLKD